MKELAIKLEGYETPAWAARRILDVEIMTPDVLDPCVGFFMMTNAAEKCGYNVITIDVYSWDSTRSPDHLQDFLTWVGDLSNTTVFMNPPFSLACDFVDHARVLNARKIICFQRFAWREGSFNKGKERGAWWAKKPPARVWVCGDRATCKRFDLLGESMSATTAHAYFIWERGHKGAETLNGLYK